MLWRFSRIEEKFGILCRTVCSGSCVYIGVDSNRRYVGNEKIQRHFVFTVIQKSYWEK